MCLKIVEEVTELFKYVDKFMTIKMSKWFSYKCNSITSQPNTSTAKGPCLLVGGGVVILFSYVLLMNR